MNSQDYPDPWAALEREDPPPSPYQRVVWADHWDSETTQEWLLEPLIPAGGQVALYSDPKVGKSLLMLELAAGLACGKGLLGQPAGDPVPVMYVDHENRLEQDIIGRLKAMGYTARDLENLHMVSMPQAGSLDTTTGGLDLVRAAQACSAALVVIDTVSRTIQGEENSNDTWLQFYRSTGVGLKAAGIALVRLDHTGKDADKGQRGGSAKSGDVDMVWRLKRVTDDVYELICEAHRMEIGEDRLALKRSRVPLGHSVVGNGPAAVNDARRVALLEALTATGCDPTAGVLEATTWLRSQGHPVRNGTITKGVLDQWRRGIPTLPGDLVPIGRESGNGN